MRSVGLDLEGEDVCIYRSPVIRRMHVVCVFLGLVIFITENNLYAIVYLGPNFCHMLLLEM